MSLNSILRMGASGLKVSQASLRTVSENISNVNTPGYVRKVVEQQSSSINGVGYGVEIGSVRRAADIYLQRTALNAVSEAGRADTVAGFLDRAQIMFGDPSNDTSFFKQLDDIFSAFATAAEDPTSNLRRTAAVTEVTRFFDNAALISRDLTALRLETDGRLAAAADQVNGLLDEINKLNTEVSSAVIRGRDATGAENAQSKLIDELSTLLDFKVSPRPLGGVTLRAGDGTELVGGNNDGPARLSFDRFGGAGLLNIVPFGGKPQAFAAGLEGGEIKGLVELRQTVLPGISEQLGELTTRAADALNKAHNAASPVPAPATMTGRRTGLDLPGAIAGFTGRSSITVTNAAGTETRRIDIDFDQINAAPPGAGGLSVNGVPVAAFGPATFLTELNTALGAGRSAGFSGGVLSLSTSNAGEGLVVLDDPAAPADRGGRGFSHFFGLNDLVRSPRYTFYETGLRPGDEHGFTPGQTITFRLTNSAGGLEDDVRVTVPSPPAGSTTADLLGALNDPNGMGRYGAFTLDAAGGLSFTSNAARPVILLVREDLTTRGAGGPSMTELFGLGSEIRATRAETFKVRADIAQNSTKLSFAQAEYAVPVGTRQLAKGNNTGAFGLSNAGEALMSFQPAGEVGRLNMSVSRYAAELGGVVGRASSYAAERRSNAELVAKEANARRAGVEGVNMDEELIRLTTYQQSYNASARLIQAASEMFETLVNMI